MAIAGGPRNRPRGRRRQQRGWIDDLPPAPDLQPHQRRARRRGSERRARANRAPLAHRHRGQPRDDRAYAGFVLDSQSPILRNPADPKTASVFDASIRGKTDQFILRFHKPQ